MSTKQLHANTEEELIGQLEEAKTEFLREKPHPDLMIKRIANHSVTDATAMIYFESIQELMEMNKPMPPSAKQELNERLLNAMKKYPAIVLTDD